MDTNRKGGSNPIIMIVIFVIVAFVLVKTCSNKRRRSSYRNNTSTASKWQKSPIDDLIKTLSDEQNFSIILLDMDADDPTLGASKYKHQYRVIIDKPDTVTSSDTDWEEVSEAVFKHHINDMGMEIASKMDGVVKKQAVPAGYSNYVGNARYGHWSNRNGSSFWEFYGRYAFMSSMFNMMSPARRNYYDDYRRGGYYGSGRSYYGPAGKTVFGTKSYTSSSGKSSTWGSKSTDFKSKVRSGVSRSTSASSSRSYSSGSSYGSKTSRSSSRSSSSSSYRGRSGGSGK